MMWAIHQNPQQRGDSVCGSVDSDVIGLHGMPRHPVPLAPVPVVPADHAGLVVSGNLSSDTVHLLTGNRSPPSQERVLCASIPD